jgi:lysyl-tRNA synthetase class 2
VSEPNWHLSKKRATLEKRARILQQVRAFFIDRSFLEVETPLRIPANAPELHIDSVASDTWFLQTSPELCMKRLLAAGYERIFQISHCWRAEERGRFHLPEYSMLEWYRSDCDYHRLMDDCEQLLLSLMGQRQLSWQGQQIDLSPPWPRLTVDEAFARYAPVDLEQALDEGSFDEHMALTVEPQLPKGRPLFLCEYPQQHAALARLKATDPRVAERFELYIGGLELANAFSELNDAQEQRNRFAAEEQARRAAGKAQYPSPEPFLNELGQMPDSAGIALGIDRLVMLLCDLSDIAECVCFTPEHL